MHSPGVIIAKNFRYPRSTDPPSPSHARKAYYIPKTAEILLCANKIPPTRQLMSRSESMTLNLATSRGIFYYTLQADVMWNVRKVLSRNTTMV